LCAWSGSEGLTTLLAEARCRDIQRPATWAADATVVLRRRRAVAITPTPMVTPTVMATPMVPPSVMTAPMVTPTVMATSMVTAQ